MLRWINILLAAVCANWAQAPAALPPAAERPVPYEEVQTLFEARCYSCHGAEKQKGGLRLDARSAALEGGDSGPSILPGKSAESKLVHLVAGLDPEEVMPPKGKRLKPEEISALRAWIDQGAAWTESAGAGPAKSSHWSFQQIKRIDPPAVKNNAWVRNPIDNFILARLEKEGVLPSPEATKATLARRVHLDLLGLPPTLETLERFLRDSSAEAYDRMVDATLESPHFGEQWARHWLDLARYADTDGYEKDFYRPHAWRWRDWVIQSLNSDQPFDEFTLHQIAGDLLPNAPREAKVATGFHRNSLLNREGGVDIEEDRTKIVVDRVSTVGTTWLGLTVGCAECHTHKYDPITQKEFYQLYAFFNSVDDRDIRAPLPEQKDEVQIQESELALAKARYVESDHPKLEEWAAEIAALPDIWFTPPQDDYELPTFGANNGANLYHQEDGSFLATGMVDGKCHYVMMLNTKTNGLTGIRVEVMTDEMLPKLGPGWGTNGNFILNEVYVESASLADVSNLKRHRLASVKADYSEAGHGIEQTIDDEHNKGGWAVSMPDLPISGLDRCAVYALEEKIGHAEGMRLKVNLVQQHGSSHTLGRVRVSYTTAAPDQLAAHTTPERIKQIARLPKVRRTLDESVTLKRYYQATFEAEAPELLAISKALAEAPGVKGEVQAPTLTERKLPRPTHIHVRGNFLDRGPAVEHGVLSALHDFKPRQAKADRVDLANWLVDPKNPLTARVAVNHIWRQLFGEGLVATMGDFGTQGDLPTHPELLDWLASEFMRLGWSRKQLIKLIVSSATYQQSSETRGDLLDRDAKNKLLARQNRFRLSGENARDQYLAASGLLNRKIGGQSITPEKPRRGLYVQFKRAYPEYMLTSFDAPSSTAACPARERSNTPLQALTLLNDQLFLDCARKLAADLTTSATATDARIEKLFRLTVSRAPTAHERAEAKALHSKALEYYEANTEAAQKLLAHKEPQPRMAEPAAWTVVARAILNLDQVITRE